MIPNAGDTALKLKINNCGYHFNSCDLLSGAIHRHTTKNTSIFTYLDSAAVLEINPKEISQKKEKGV